MEDKISIREIINLMLRRKWIIISITVLALLAGAVATSLAKPTPRYRAQSILHLQHNQDSMKPTIKGYYGVLVAAILNAEQINTEALGPSIRQPEFIARVGEKLRLAEKGIAPDFLNKAEMAIDETSSSITITIIHADSQIALEAANMFAEQIILELTQRQTDQIQDVADNLEDLISFELQGLYATLEYLEAARANYSPLITYQGTSHITPEYNILSIEAAGILSEISNLEAQHYQIQRARGQATTMLRNPDEWISLSTATTSHNITPPSSRRNIPIFAAIGFMASILIGAFLDYWEKTTKSVIEK